MQNVSCPSCGGPVSFRSPTSVMAVCGFCRCTLLKDAEAVRDQGTMSEVLKDYSPIQIGTSGEFDDCGFTVIGRIQLRYPEGMWNEWYVLFSDGGSAWLSDASGSYALTRERGLQEAPPAFEKLKPGQSHQINGTRYTVSDVRTAECTGGQGELPFTVGKGWKVRAADLRNESEFVTLDYSDEEQSRAYLGQTVTLEKLRCQLLRDRDQIDESVSRYEQNVRSLNCPACGASTRFVPGATIHLSCAGCQAQVDTSGEVAEVLKAGQKVENISLSLPLGHELAISEKTYTVIGAMRRCDNHGNRWTEYLLHHPGGGFLWQVETKDGWMRGAVCEKWPDWDGDKTALLGSEPFEHSCEYKASVTFAVGAFNWRVRVGDSNRVMQFVLGEMELTAEINNHEMTWSLMKKFGPEPTESTSAVSVATGSVEEEPEVKLVPIAQTFIVLLVVVNMLPMVGNFMETLLPMVLLVAAIYFPASIHDSSNESESDKRDSVWDRIGDDEQDDSDD